MTSTVDHEALKQRARAVWGLGDYALASALLEPAAVALSEACAVAVGEEVLDVGAGDGNFAAACARAGARVVATDLSPVMVERGRTRTARAGLEVTWSEADAEALPFDDGRFDCVGSTFGVITAPRPAVAAGELFRVTRRGGTVGLTAWPEDGEMADLFTTSMSFSPEPATRPAAAWGTEADVRTLLEPVAGDVRIERRSLLIHDNSPATLLERIATGAGPFRALSDALPPERAEALRRAQLDVLEARNDAADGTITLRPEYLLVVARRA